MSIPFWNMELNCFPVWNLLHCMVRLRQRSSILSFNIQGVHPYDAGMVMDKMGIAVRTGTHCAQTVMQHFGIQGTIRASIAMYNTREELDELAEAVKKVKTMFS